MDEILSKCPFLYYLYSMILIKDKYSDVLIGIFRNQKKLCDKVGLPYHSIRNMKWIDSHKEYQNYSIDKHDYGLLNGNYIKR